jgi:hypothetical protein
MVKAKTHFEQVPLEVVKKIAVIDESDISEADAAPDKDKPNVEQIISAKPPQAWT